MEELYGRRVLPVRNYPIYLLLTFTAYVLFIRYVIRAAVAIFSVLIVLWICNCLTFFLRDEGALRILLRRLPSRLTGLCVPY